MRACWSRPDLFWASVSTATVFSGSRLARVAAMPPDPNPVHREPSTCARCKNFAVSAAHRPYWLEQMRRCEALLHEPALPTQTLKIVRERLEEARAMLRSIHSSAKDEGHGRKASH